VYISSYNIIHLPRRFHDVVVSGWIVVLKMSRLARRLQIVIIFLLVLFLDNYVFRTKTIIRNTHSHVTTSKIDDERMRKLHVHPVAKAN